jgi:hypothetical protein
MCKFANEKMCKWNTEYIFHLLIVLRGKLGELSLQICKYENLKMCKYKSHISFAICNTGKGRENMKIGKYENVLMKGKSHIPFAIVIPGKGEHYRIRENSLPVRRVYNQAECCLRKDLLRCFEF